MKKIKVNFTKGCVELNGGIERPLYIDRQGVWFREKRKKIYLKPRNCEVL